MRQQQKLTFLKNLQQRPNTVDHKQTWIGTQTGYESGSPPEPTSPRWWLPSKHAAHAGASSALFCRAPADVVPRLSISLAGNAERLCTRLRSLPSHFLTHLCHVLNSPLCPSECLDTLEWIRLSSHQPKSPKQSNGD